MSHAYDFTWRFSVSGDFTLEQGDASKISTLVFLSEHFTLELGATAVPLGAPCYLLFTCYVLLIKQIRSGCLPGSRHSRSVYGTNDGNLPLVCATERESTKIVTGRDGTGQRTPEKCHGTGRFPSRSRKGCPVRYKALAITHKSTILSVSPMYDHNSILFFVSIHSCTEHRPERHFDRRNIAMARKSCSRSRRNATIRAGRA